MLSKPNAGWTMVSLFGKAIGSASYLDDVPFMLLYQFINYFSESKQNMYPMFLTEFDAEGYYFGFLLWDGTLYEIDDQYGELRTSEIEIPYDLYIRGDMHKLMSALAKELIHDIRTYVDEWAIWDPDVECQDDEKARRNELQKLCNKLEQYLE